jgi:hypothetical protein
MAGASTGKEPAGSLARVRAQFDDIASYYGLEIDLGGLRLRQSVLDSSKAMGCLIGNAHGGGLFANFFQELDLKYQLLEADVISLGIDNPHGVYWALQLAAWARASGSRPHLCIARHSHENFSLQHHLDALRENDRPASVNGGASGPGNSRACRRSVFMATVPIAGFERPFASTRNV